MSELEAIQSSSRDIDARIAQLERRVRYLGVAFLLLVLASVSVYVYNANARRQGLVTRWLFTREFNVPSPQEWSSVGVIGGLAPAIDGKSIAFWLAATPLSANHHQTRISLEDNGSQRIEMFDSKGRIRLRLGTTSEGAPSIALFGPDGQPTWSAPVALGK
jgi:hypothetical protein